jgi:hypothetical protein
MKEAIDDEALAKLVIDLRSDSALCHVAEDARDADPRIICSLGLRSS